MASLELLASLAASCLYDYFLYPLTVDVFAGFSYVIASVIMLLPTALVT